MRLRNTFDAIDGVLLRFDRRGLCSYSYRVPRQYFPVEPIRTSSNDGISPSRRRRSASTFISASNCGRVSRCRAGPPSLRWYDSGIMTGQIRPVIYPGLKREGRLLEICLGLVGGTFGLVVSPWLAKFPALPNLYLLWAIFGVQIVFNLWRLRKVLRSRSD